MSKLILDINNIDHTYNFKNIQDRDKTGLLKLYYYLKDHDISCDMILDRNETLLIGFYNTIPFLIITLYSFVFNDILAEKKFQKLFSFPKSFLKIFFSPGQPTEVILHLLNSRITHHRTIHCKTFEEVQKELFVRTLHSTYSFQLNTDSEFMSTTSDIISIIKKKIDVERIYTFKHLIPFVEYKNVEIPIPRFHYIFQYKTVLFLFTDRFLESREKRINALKSLNCLLKTPCSRGIYGIFLYKIDDLKPTDRYIPFYRNVLFLAYDGKEIMGDVRKLFDEFCTLVINRNNGSIMNEEGETPMDMDSDDNHTLESTTPSTTGRKKKKMIEWNFTNKTSRISEYSTSSKNKKKDPDRSNEESKKSESDDETPGFKIVPRNRFRNVID
ncbi:6253_t:CDS:2 [Cetraspora pellucida]|uniref:6253_t:CDS:1 n=1 Tax=Cetraspora pellucida TaxID=1433469 RepID=A0A9N9CS73_9GLOM|nr:6253_t:CDS:2 [Cetraspora pellucida]